MYCYLVLPEKLKFGGATQLVDSDKYRTQLKKNTISLKNQ